MNETILTEQINNFIVGFDDGQRDLHLKSGRSLDKSDPDWGAGYVAGRYGQVLYQPIQNRKEALKIWSGKLYVSNFQNWTLRKFFRNLGVG